MGGGRMRGRVEAVPAGDGGEAAGGRGRVLRREREGHLHAGHQGECCKPPPMEREQLVA